jgi:hypothetical protein
MPPRPRSNPRALGSGLGCAAGGLRCVGRAGRAAAALARPEGRAIAAMHRRRASSPAMRRCSLGGQRQLVGHLARLVKHVLAQLAAGFAGLLIELGGFARCSWASVSSTGIHCIGRWGSARDAWVWTAIDPHPPCNEVYARLCNGPKPHSGAPGHYCRFQRTLRLRCGRFAARLNPSLAASVARTASTHRRRPSRRGWRG